MEITGNGISSSLILLLPFLYLFFSPGLFYGLFQLSFLHLSAGLTKQLKLAPGGEFRAAYNKGKELGCNFKLSDRSIQVTQDRM